MVYVTKRVCDMSINVIGFQITYTVFYHKFSIFSNIIYIFLLGATIKIMGIYFLIENKMTPK